MKIVNYLPSVSKMVAELDQLSIVNVMNLIIQAKNDGRNIFVFGNGGSGANASHFVQDLLKCPIRDFDSASNRYKAICLNDNTPVIMAYANDISYEQVFVQQLMNFCQKGDVVIGISGSGNSKNVINAIEYANQIGAHSVGVVGFDGGELLNRADMLIHIKYDNMQVFEDGSSIVLHGIVSNLSNEDDY